MTTHETRRVSATYLRIELSSDSEPAAAIVRNEAGDPNNRRGRNLVFHAEGENVAKDWHNSRTNSWTRNRKRRYHKRPSSGAFALPFHLAAASRAAEEPLSAGTGHPLSVEKV